MIFFSHGWTSGEWGDALEAYHHTKTVTEQRQNNYDPRTILTMERVYGRFHVTRWSARGHPNSREVASAGNTRPCRSR